MSTSGGILSLVSDVALRSDVERIAAAVGARVVHAREPSNRKVWTAASVIVLDAENVCRCAELGLPRRDRIFLIGRAEPGDSEWESAIAVGVQRVISLPAQESELVNELAEGVDAPRAGRRGGVLAVIGGRGGAGASVFATALANVADDALLIDVDPWGGGIDLALGSEGEAGLRWPDLALQSGRLGYAALRQALPVRRDITVLSAGRTGREVDAGALRAVIDAGCRGGATVICDVPRRATPAAEAALDAADLVVLVTSADVRSCAATAALGQWLVETNPNVGLVVRGPAPGGLTSGNVADIVGLPLLAAMRPQPRLAAALEHGGLSLGRRSPLTSAARRVLAVLRTQPRESVVSGSA
jgi:secretion/DNA translocation related CpaE-like protein